MKKGACDLERQTDRHRWLLYACIIVSVNFSCTVLNTFGNATCEVKTSQRWSIVSPSVPEAVVLIQVSTCKKIHCDHADLSTGSPHAMCVVRKSCHKIVTKALILKSKTIKFMLCLNCTCQCLAFGPINWQIGVTGIHAERQTFTTKHTQTLWHMHTKAFGWQTTKKEAQSDDILHLRWRVTTLMRFMTFTSSYTFLG